jgi:hypothetical protein
MSEKTDPLALLNDLHQVASEKGKVQLDAIIKGVQSLTEQLNTLEKLTPWPEAPASINFRMAHPVTLVECQFTLRDWTDDALADRLISQLANLQSLGFIPFDAYVDQRRNGRQEQAYTPASAPVPGPVAPQNGTRHPVQSIPESELFFNCTAMLPGPKSKTDHDPIWKVAGDKSQYPTAFWDLEDLTVDRLNEQRAYLAEQGVDISQMYRNNKPVEIDLTGWIAYYQMSKTGNFPGKVTKLVRVR